MKQTDRMAAEAGAQPARRGWLRWLRDARIRTKLGAILVIPLIAITTLAGFRLFDSTTRAIESQMVRSLTAVSAQAAQVSHELHRERIEAARLLADPDGGPDAFTDQTAKADAAVDTYQAARSSLGDVPELVEARLAVVDEHLAGLDGLRQQVQATPAPTPDGVLLRYGTVIGDVLAYQEQAATAVEDPGLAEQFRAAAALSAAAVQASEAHALATLAAGQGRLSAEQLGALVAAQTGQREAFSAFGRAADPDQQQVADRVITGGAVAFNATSTAALLDSPEAAVGGSSFAGMVSSTAWVEDQLYDQLLASATALAEQVFRQVLIESVAVLAALLVTILVALLLARMLARSLRNLRASAIQVAERDLPATVERLSDPRTLGENTPAQLAAQVSEPLAPRSGDEIGDVARAFNLVHRSAVKVAAEQAALRTSVAAMFLNLARRSQSLVDRMISQLDEIERNEEDPKRLARMFTLDHLATRMRRNDENLLVLAGADSSPPRTEDAELIDALRAAQSEVEHYARIEFGAVDDDVSVVARAVNDVVRLVAELFDNATRFSPPDAPVVCEARRLRDHVIVQVEDRGVGMSADQVARLNTWLASPPAVEATTFRKMGLAVVARLAARHQIRVELRCDPNYGTVVYVALPPGILLLPPSRLRHRSTTPTPELAPAAAPPSVAQVPSRYLGQRSADVVHHAATRRTTSGRNHTSTGEGRGIDLPVAGRPVYQLTGGQQPWQPGPTASAAAENHTIELPIFKEAEAVWFAKHGQQDLDLAGRAPRAGAYPTPEAHAEETATAATTLPAAHHVPADQWRTAADHGWQAAAAASDPPAAGATRSGLPRRQPQAQLVPGSVPTATTEAGPRPPGQRRSPEEVRGLLSAYHRGVLRGRETHTP